jgi:hypothetical protein
MIPTPDKVIASWKQTKVTYGTGAGCSASLMKPRR